MCQNNPNETLFVSHGIVPFEYTDTIQKIVYENAVSLFKVGVSGLSKPMSAENQERGASPTTIV
jgi:hypothetical protein